MEKRYYTIIVILIVIVILLGFKIINDATSTEALTIDGEITTLIQEDLENEPQVQEVAYKLSDYERWVVECIVMGEAQGESYKGKLLVAQCILNACLKDGLTPSQVRQVYKYSGWNENPDIDVKNAVSDIFDYGHKVVDEPILYFYAPKYIHSNWHETQKHVITEGGHKFFAEWED